MQKPLASVRSLGKNEGKKKQKFIDFYVLFILLMLDGQ